jgi:phage terminase large subunit-like protein
MTWTYERPRLAAYQVAALFNESRYAVVEASTKAGKTVGCLVWLTEEALKGRPGQNFWWVAPIRDQATIAFRRLKQMLPRHLYEAHQGDRTLSLRNGAVIWFKSADRPDSLYGEDVYAAVVDEATRVKEDA